LGSPGGLIAVLLDSNPLSATAFEAQSAEMQHVARAVGQRIQLFAAASERELDSVFAAIAESQPQGLFVGISPFLQQAR
jgi:hypothetical protein